MIALFRAIPLLPVILSALLLATGARADTPTAVPGLLDQANIRRDTSGVVHITARNEHDLVLLQGWAHARDRLFQMDVLRRLASGTLAELFGAPALASDVELRTIGLRRAAVRSLAVLSPETQAMLEAYAAGVNHYVATHPLPIEYGALERTVFEPWTPEDSVVIAKLFSFSLSFDLDIAPTLTLLTYQGVGDAAGFDGLALYFEDTHRAAPFTAAATVPDAGGAAVARAAAAAPGPHGAAAIQPATQRLAQRYLDRVQGLSAFRAALDPGTRRKGSNLWVVAGRHSETGRPLIANDPHLDLSIPATFYPIHLRADAAGFDVSGEGFAGAPYVVLGQNRHIAWAATTNPMDVTDTYQEQIVPDPNSPSGLSIVHNGGNEPILPLPQIFRYNVIGDMTPDNLATAPAGGTVAGIFIPPAVLIVPRRNNGPILALDVAAGWALSVQYTGFSGTRELDTFRGFNLARELADFVHALQYFDVGSQNFAYADVRGNIAYFTSAEAPLREDLEQRTVAGLPPFFIRNGTGGNEWLPVRRKQPGQAVPFEILPFREMPKLINPATGVIVNANNDPVGATFDNDPLNQVRPGGGIFYLNHGYDLGIRAGRIADRLKAMIAAGPVGAADMAALQADIVMADAQRFAPLIAAAFANPDAVAAVGAAAAEPRVAEAVARLEAWDHSAPTGVIEGYDSSDVDGTLSAPDEAEIANSIAATIYAVWRGRMIGNTVDAVLDGLTLPRPGDKESVTALKHLFDSFPATGGVGASGLNFFVFAGVTDPVARRDAVILQSLIEALDLLSGGAFVAAFGGSADQDDYRWGRLHRLVLDHPLDVPFSIPPAGGAFPASFPDLPGIAVDGGFAVIDRADHAVRAAGSDDFMFDAGPVRRYVGEFLRGRGGIDAVSSLPGGTSGDLTSPFYANLLAGWLTNDTYPVLRSDADIAAATIEDSDFTP